MSEEGDLVPYAELVRKRLELVANRTVTCQPKGRRRVGSRERLEDAKEECQILLGAQSSHVEQHEAVLKWSIVVRVTSCCDRYRISKESRGRPEPLCTCPIGERLRWKRHHVELIAEPDDLPREQSLSRRDCADLRREDLFGHVVGVDRLDSELPGDANG